MRSSVWWGCAGTRCGAYLPFPAPPSRTANALDSVASLLNVAGSMSSIWLASWMIMASSMDSIGEHWPNRPDRATSLGFIMGLIRLMGAIIPII